MDHTEEKKNIGWKKSEEEAFRGWMVSREMSENTVDKYIRDVRRFCAYAGTDGIRSVSREDVLAYKKWLTAKYKTSSVNSMLAALNCCFRFFEREELRVRACRVQRIFFVQEEREINREEYFRLVREAKRQGMEQMEMILQTMASTGVRVSELCWITAEAVRLGYARIRMKGKERVILLPLALRERLSAYCEKKGIEEGRLFNTAQGTPVDRRQVWRDMKQLCRASGVAESKGFPHNLRHLFARTYYEKEKNLVRLADYLGHSSIETTRRYTMTGAMDACQRQLELGLVLPEGEKRA